MARRRRPLLAVVDVGNTTVAEGGLVKEAIRGALGDVGLPVTPELVRGLAGPDRRAVLAEATAAAGLGPDAVEQSMAAFAARVLADIRAGRYRLLPGVHDALLDLRAAGIRIAATTNFAVPLRGPLLAATGLDHFVVAAVSIEEVQQPGQPPYMTRTAMERAGIDDPGHVANIGDTALDLAAGRAAGVGYNIGILPAEGEHAGLKRQRGDVYALDFADAVRYVLRHVEPALRR
jgi:phosphoglycolate phosphatase